ncbi:MAG: acyl-[acyl-carrier-protein] thioesterase [Acetatifactor sp.]|nr:acyl-[acyl-carrier-protein] thioesterase [Acetatifactor sp.]
MYFFDGRIRYSEADSKGKLTLVSLLDYFQDCSTFHSEDLGIGVEYLAKRHLVWVLCSWQIVVERYPKLNERVKIGTSPYEFKSFLGSRNFVMMTEEGEYLAKANSLWSLLDTQTWKPTAPPEEMLKAYVLSPKLDMDYAPRKIVVPAGGNDMDVITVKKHHLDTNNHVNNGRYVDMAMEFLPENFAIRQMRAEYKKQAHLDDILYPYVAGENGRLVVALRDESGKPYVVVEFE